MERWARVHYLTLNTLIQGAWALLLSHYSGDEDVVFGAAFPGRPPELAGIEALVGPCVTNIPVRLQVNPEQTLVAWLTVLQETHSEIAQHQYASLEQVQRWSSVPWRRRLFDSLVVFQNYASDATDRLGPSIVARVVSAPEATNYLLTLTVTPGPELVLKTSYDRQRLDPGAVLLVLEDLRTLLESMPLVFDRATVDAARPLARGHEGEGRAHPDVAAGDPAIARRDTPPRAANGIGADDHRDMAGPVPGRRHWQGRKLLRPRRAFAAVARGARRIQAQSAPTLPIVALFQYPTINALARYLNDEADRHPPIGTCAIAPAADGGPGGRRDRLGQAP